MLSSEGLLLKSGEGFFDILKSDDLIIGGYASIEVVDKQNDLITLEALDDAVHKFMGEKNYRNVMSNHSNVQVGEVVESYRDNNGTLHKTGVDDVGFYVVIKLREDIEKAKEIVLCRGDKFHIYRGLRHQMFALEDTDLFEFSTQHFEHDSNRVIQGD